jgi:hypothetical protein
VYNSREEEMYNRKRKVCTTERREGWKFGLDFSKISYFAKSEFRGHTTVERGEGRDFLMLTSCSISTERYTTGRVKH